MRKFIVKVRETGFIVDAPRGERARAAHTSENIETLAESLCENPSTSTHHRFQKLNISRTGLYRILRKDLIPGSLKVNWFRN